jgi:hypothetical protein
MGFRQELIYAFRSLIRMKGLTVTVVLTLALGIGANAAIFSLVRAVLLRPFVNRDEQRLVYIRQSAPGIDPRTKNLFAVPMESDEYPMPVGGRFTIYRSRNGGESWEPLMHGLPSGPYYAGVLRGALAVDGLEPTGIYVGSTSGDVFVSGDAGETRQQLPVRLPRVLSVAAYVED